MELGGRGFPGRAIGVVADDGEAAQRQAHGMQMEFRSGDALFVFDADQTILSWNDAAEELTGIPAAEAIGRRCWEVLRGVDLNGSLVCHGGCSGARLASEGWPVHCQQLVVNAPGGGRQEVSVSTVAVRNGSEPLFLHLLRQDDSTPAAREPEPAKPNDREPRLTDRQLEVLRMMADGLNAKAIARLLGIAEPTVRNHIRSILLELGCHSQLAALATARRWRMID
jgi:PAS domain S-box-containing protein